MLYVVKVTTKDGMTSWRKDEVGDSAKILFCDYLRKRRREPRQQRALRQAGYLKVSAPKLTEVKEKAGSSEFSWYLREFWSTLHLPRNVYWYTLEEECNMPIEPIEE